MFGGLGFRPKDALLKGTFEIELFAYLIERQRLFLPFFFFLPENNAEILSLPGTVLGRPEEDGAAGKMARGPPFAQAQLLAKGFLLYYNCPPPHPRTPIPPPRQAPLLGQFKISAGEDPKASSGF